MAATYEPIATTTLGSGVATITFASIPQTYTDLILSFNGDAGSGIATYLNLNNDGGTNYSYLYFYADGSYPYTNSQTSQTAYRYSGPGGIQNSFHLINFLSYTSSTYKTILQNGAMTTTGASGNGPLLECGLWRSTAAITRIDLTNSSSINFSAGTIATLYGVKAA